MLISSAGNVETLRVTTAPQPEQNISCKAAEGGAARLSTRVNLDHHRRLFLVVAARTDGSCLSHVRCICIPGGAEPLISGNLSCHVRLIKEGGRYGQVHDWQPTCGSFIHATPPPGTRCVWQAFSAFTYVNPSPAQRPIDISCGAYFHLDEPRLCSHKIASFTTVLSLPPLLPSPPLRVVY